MNFRSYQGKVFLIESSKAIVRDNNLAELRYQAGDTLPPGKSVGDVKIIPQRTEINVTDVKIDSDRHTFVFARGAQPPNESFGWTSATNLVGGFTNETLGLAPAKWDLEPQGNNMTVVDGNALIRSGPPDFTSTGATVPQRAFVIVTDTSGENMKISKLTIANGQATIGAEIGWTRSANLRDGCSDIYFSPEWLDEKGPNACWRHGTFIGAKLLVNIVGFGAEMEQVTMDSLDPYLKLKNAAADESNIEISINSAFRTFQRQAELRHLFEIGQGNNAAQPGTSNHEHGQAFDLNTMHNVFNGSDKVYEWLKKNGPKHGFVRAVSKESWHWEYRPVEAASLAAEGKFMLPGIHD